MRKKILHILNTSAYSGAENVVINIINAMNHNCNYDFVYVSLDGTIRETLTKSNIKFEPIKKLSILEVRRVVQKYNPTIIHAHDFTASIICSVAGLKIPIISHLHNNSPWLKKYCLNSFIYLFSTLNYKKVLAVSPSVFDEYVFRTWIRNKSMVISNPIDISIVQAKAKLVNSKISYDLVFIGRLSSPKNPQRFISLVAQAKKKFPNIKTVMIGHGALAHECKRAIHQRGLSNHIDLLGFLENPYGILSKARALCITSDWEGYGLVAVEALSLGVPVLATPVGGLPGIVSADCGALCNSDDMFIVEIEKMLSDEVNWQKKSKNALLQAQSLNNLDEYIANIDRLYQDLSNA